MKNSLLVILIVTIVWPAVAVAQDDSEPKASTPVEATSELTFQPPLVPIVLSVNSRGEPAIKISPECATPFGTFGIGGGVSAVNDDDNTYFIFRASSKEAVYCVGTHGKLRIHAEGKHTIDISQHDKHRNTLVVDITTLKGEIKAEFVPDDKTDFLASFSDKILNAVYLDKAGDIVSGPRNSKKAGRFHFRIKKEDIKEIQFCDFNGKSLYGIGDGMLVAICNSNTGKITGAGFPIPKDSLMAARWLCYCHKHSIKRPTSIIKRVHDYNGSCMIFDDGSILNGIFVPSSLIKSVSLDMSSYFGASIEVACKADFHFGESNSVPFFSDTAATKFFKELRKHHAKTPED